jgi:hypothetical protein
LNIRRATLQDVPALLELKAKLRFAGTTRGGFLLGTDELGYELRVRDGKTWLLESQAKVLGFAITMGASTFSQTPLWQLRRHVNWSASVELALNAGVGYFDQLAVERGTAPRAAALLAFVALWHVLTTDKYLVTTTVVSPVRNAAAVPLVELVGGKCVGTLEEVYEDFGALTSSVWLISAEEARRRVQAAMRSHKPTVLRYLAHVATRAGHLDLTALA